MASVGLQSVLDRLNSDHKRIEMVLRLIERELGKFDNDDQDENLSAIADALEYIEAYPDKVHHPVEERMFDLLADKAPSPVQETLAQLRGQHSEITASTSKLKQDIDNVLNDIVTPIDRIKRHLTDYVNLQRRHMTLERQTIFPFAEAALDNKDWQSLQHRLDAELDPLFDETLVAFETLYDHVVEELD